MMRFTTALLSVCLFTLALACTKKANKTDYGLDPSETLRVNILTEPPSLDWSVSSDTTSYLVQNNIMEGLTNFDLKDPDLKLLPGLATKWETTDAKNWVFTLREDVKWTDGVPFEAQHIIDGWERLLRPEIASKYAYYLYGIKNARAYNEGKIKDFKEVGVKVNEKGQLLVELEQSKSYFPYLLVHHTTYPLRKDIVEKYGDQWTEPEHIVTLGAYKLVKWDHDKALVLERNENYFGSPAKIKNIILYMILETSTAINLFDAGRLDALHELPPQEIPILKKREEYVQKGILNSYYYGFNTRKPPFDDVRVRKAFTMAIDRNQITQLQGGGETPLSGWIPVGMFGNDPNIGIEFDVDKARQLLDEAGYKDRSKFPKITLGFNTLDKHQRIAENVQAQIKKNLGIQLELSNEEWKTYLDTLRNNAPSIYRMGWVADYPDPDNFLNLMTSYSDNNHTGWGNKRYDEIIETAVSLTDQAKRAELYREAQKILTEIDVAVDPLFSETSKFLVSPRVENYPVNPMRQFIYKDVIIKKESK